MSRKKVLIWVYSVVGIGVLVCGFIIYLILAKQSKAGEVYSTANTSKEVVYETEPIEQLDYTLDELKRLKAFRRDGGSVSANGVGDLSLSGITTSTSGGIHSSSVSEEPVEVENVYAPKVSWADGTIDTDSLRKVLNCVGVLYEDKLQASGEDCYVTATYVTGENLEKFEVPVIWWLTDDFELVISTKLEIYNLSSGEKKEVYKPITVRFTPEELEIVE